MQTEVFNALSMPIDQTNLIEASAGTGKTWSIAALFLRLVLIERVAVDKILVVTFTNAATAELKTRLRARLDEALRALKGVADEDAQQLLQDASETQIEPFLKEVLLLALEQEAASRVVLRLQAALNQFDHAGIFTIHGFCQRVLQEFAFLCQVPFKMKLADDTQPSKQRLAADFWRLNVLHDAEKAQLCVDEGITLESVLRNIQSWFSRDERHLSFDLEPQSGGLKEATEQLHQTAQTVLQQLPQLKQTFTDLHPLLNGNSYRANTYANLFASLSEALTNKQWQVLPKLKTNILKLSPENLLGGLKKNQSLSDGQSHAFLDLITLMAQVDRIETSKQALFDQLHYDLYRYLLPAWQKEKQRLQAFGFDDLLMDVAQALHHPQYGERLATYINTNMWQMALIDEFQDTDPLQYGIFDAIYRQYKRPLFLVGDPKQAIYRFRGADIHAYLQAKQEANRLYTLDTNRRTHQQLVASVNALFLNKTKPFLLDNIDYIDVKASRQDSDLVPNTHPLQVQYLLKDDETFLNTHVAKQRAADYCAANIAQHLALSAQGQLHYKGEALQAKHMAVLVRAHKEGELVQKSLRKIGISSVILSRDSIFAALEAKPILTLLQWWQAPQQQGLLRSVLAGLLFNYRVSDLMRLNLPEHQDELIAWIEDASVAQTIWQERGVFAAWQMFDKKRGISADFLRRKDKRGLTNVQQLFELLAQEEIERFGAGALVQWYSEQIAQQSNQDAFNLRLESDEELVKIVTMHASKGLQYPIVFCPFVWIDREFKADDFNLLHQEGRVSVVSKPRLDEATQTVLHEDHASETLRLLYVAFTRAEEKLILSASLLKNNASAHNVLHHLLHPDPDASVADSETLWKAAGADKRVFYQGLWQNWAKSKQVPMLWLDKEPENMTVLQDALNLPTYQALEANLPFYRIQEYTSFSGISRHISHIPREELVPDIDQAELQDTSMNDVDLDDEEMGHELDLFHFQRGTKAGLCLHALLEETDFSQAALTQTERYAPIFDYYQITPEWYDALYDMIDVTRLAQLDNGVCLADIPASKTLAEMTFVLKVDHFTAKDIQKWLKHSPLPQSIKQAAQGLQFRDIMGFLNGAIDLICISQNGRVYVVDYKSNHLGNMARDYQTEHLNAAIVDHHYYLQALIYAIAVKRYLDSRQFEFDAIHVRYLFLRGMKAQSNQGIWHWDIEKAALDKIDAALAS